MQYKHILVTGGAGFIGSYLVDFLISKGHRVRILDNLDKQIHSQGRLPDYLNTHAEFIKGTVTKRSDWQKALLGVDVVVHLAAAVGIGQSMYEVARYTQVNCYGTSLLLDILANEKHQVKKILLAASMSSYGEGLYQCGQCGLVQQPGLRDETNLRKHLWQPLCQKCAARLTEIATNEQAKLNSPSVYAITKKFQEDMFLSFGKAYGIPAVSLRFFNVYGPRQSLSNPYTGVTAIFISRVKNHQPPLINEDGQQTRDFIHVKDVVEAIYLCLTQAKANYQIFNVGSGIPISINQVAKMIIRLFASNLRPHVTEKFRPFDIRHCYADTKKLNHLLGWKAKIDLEQGMHDLYIWSQRQTAVDRVDQAMNELRQRRLSKS